MVVVLLQAAAAASQQRLSWLRVSQCCRSLLWGSQCCCRCCNNSNNSNSRSRRASSSRSKRSSSGCKVTGGVLELDLGRVLHFFCGICLLVVISLWCGGIPGCAQVGGGRCRREKFCLQSLCCTLRPLINSRMPTVTASTTCAVCGVCMYLSSTNRSVCPWYVGLLFVLLHACGVSACCLCSAVAVMCQLLLALQGPSCLHSGLVLHPGAPPPVGDMAGAAPKLGIALEFRQFVCCCCMTGSPGLNLWAL